MALKVNSLTKCDTRLLARGLEDLGRSVNRDRFITNNGGKVCSQQRVTKSNNIVVNHVYHFTIQQYYNTTAPVRTCRC